MNQKRKKIFVTKTFMPPKSEYFNYLSQIWESDKITNQGPLLASLEAKLASYLGVNNIQVITNGTLALQISIKALELRGEILTTPFSYVATSSSIIWEDCRPVFIDIEPINFNIDVKKIEKAITPNTVAIMPVHVFGVPCDVEKIEVIARRHKLKVIYDAAHAFGVRHKNKSLLSYGDISICSFHATKIFHTIEGGSITTRDKAVAEKIGLMKEFGHFGNDYAVVGINAKASEFQAAMGLCNLGHIDEIIRKRKNIFLSYQKNITDKVQKPAIPEELDYNYSYYPVVFNSEKDLLRAISVLAKFDIYPRRYFYPSLNTLPYLDSRQHCPISEDISSRVLCLPLSTELSKDDVTLITGLINGVCSE